jgi:hypothetical protein
LLHVKPNSKRRVVDVNLSIIGAIVGAAILILAFLVVIAVIRGRKKEKRGTTERKDEYLDLCRKANRAEQGDIAAQKVIADYYSGENIFYPERSERYVKVAQQFGDVELAKRIPRIVEACRDRLEYEYCACPRAIGAWHDAKDDRSSYEAAKQLALYFRDLRKANKKRLADESGITLTKIIQHLTRLQQVLYDTHYATIQRGEAGAEDALSSLQNLIGESRKKYNANVEWLHDQGWPRLDYPENWDQLVAERVHNPSLGWFINTPRDLAPGQLRLRAEAALLEEDILGVKLVLAYCNYSLMNREELGDVLTHELGRFVEIWVRNDVQTASEVDATA